MPGPQVYGRIPIFQWICREGLRGCERGATVERSETGERAMFAPAGQTTARAGSRSELAALVVRRQAPGPLPSGKRPFSLTPRANNVRPYNPWAPKKRKCPPRKTTRRAFPVQKRAYLIKANRGYRFSWLPAFWRSACGRRKPAPPPLRPEWQSRCTQPHRSRWNRRTSH